MRLRIENKVAQRPPLSLRFDRSGTTVRCADGYARLRRDCEQLEDDGTWVPRSKDGVLSA